MSASSTGCLHNFLGKRCQDGLKTTGTGVCSAIDPPSAAHSGHRAREGYAFWLGPGWGPGRAYWHCSDEPSSGAPIRCPGVNRVDVRVRIWLHSAEQHTYRYGWSAVSARGDAQVDQGAYRDMTSAVWGSAIVKVSNGENAGFMFPATGSAQAVDWRQRREYGGLIFAYGGDINERVRLFAPSSTSGVTHAHSSVVHVGDGYGTAYKKDVQMVRLQGTDGAFISDSAAGRNGFMRGHFTLLYNALPPSDKAKCRARGYVCDDNWGVANVGCNSAASGAWGGLTANSYDLPASHHIEDGNDGISRTRLDDVGWEWTITLEGRRQGPMREGGA